MGALTSLCSNTAEADPPTASDIQVEKENPFEVRFTKKERTLLYETWQRIGDAKKLMGEMLLDILDNHHELRPLFGVQQVPRVSMLQMPKMGAHIKNVVEFLEQMTNLVGLYENPTGTWQLVKKIGRHHGAHVPFLQKTPSEQQTEYFQYFTEKFSGTLMAYLTGELKSEQPPSDNPQQQDKNRDRLWGIDLKKYNKSQIEDVWRRFWLIIMEEISDAFLVEHKRITKKRGTTIMVPQHENEEKARKERIKATKRNKVGPEDPDASHSSETKKMEELLPDIDDLEDDDEPDVSNAKK